MFENELKENCIDSEARTKTRCEDKIKEIFMEELDEFVSYFIHEFEFQGVKISPSDLGDIENEHLFSISFEGHDEKLNFVYDMLIFDAPGETSILIIKCNTFRYILSEFQNGDSEYNEETGLYDILAEDGLYSDLENAKTATVKFIKEEINYFM